MSTEPNNTVLDSGTAQKVTGATCEQGTCRSGVCSPCLIVRGLVIVWLIANALWERFQ